MVKKFSLWSKLHEEVELLWCFDDFVKLYNVPVSHQLQDEDLASDSLNVSYLLDLLFLKNFDCYLLTRGVMRSDLDLAKSAFTDGLGQKVRSESFRLGFMFF